MAAAICPGSKIRSSGMGRGLGIGKGRGPIGIPIRSKLSYEEFLKRKRKSRR